METNEARLKRMTEALAVELASFPWGADEWDFGTDLLGAIGDIVPEFLQAMEESGVTLPDDWKEEEEVELTPFIVTVYKSWTGPGADTVIKEVIVLAADEEAAKDQISALYPHDDFGYEAVEADEYVAEEYEGPCGVCHGAINEGDTYFVVDGDLIHTGCVGESAE
jgi:hypothetical protein